MQKPVFIGGNLEEEIVIKAIKEGEVIVALLMTAEVLADGHAMLEAAAAVKAGQLLVPVMMTNMGYGYHMAHRQRTHEPNCSARRGGGLQLG